MQTFSVAKKNLHALYNKLTICNSGVLTNLRVDSFAAYAYTCRILNAYPVVYKRVDNPQKTTRAKRPLLFQLENNYVQHQGESKESVENSISWVVYLAFYAVERDTLL